MLPTLPTHLSRSLRLPFIAVMAALMLAATLALPSRSSAVAVANGYRDFQYQTTASAFRATADKPQSKVWHANGAWWGGLFNHRRQRQLRDLQARRGHRRPGRQTPGIRIDAKGDSRAKSHGDYFGR